MQPVRSSTIGTTASHNRQSTEKGRWPHGLILEQRCAHHTAGLHDLLMQKDFQRNGSLLDPFTSVEDARTFLNSRGGGHFEIVAQIDKKVVGFAALYRHSGRQDHVGSFTLGVHEDVQRQGIGSVLLHTLIAAGWAMMGLSRIQATVFADNHRALSLYRRFGFGIEGRMSAFARRDSGFLDALLIALVSHPTCDANLSAADLIDRLSASQSTVVTKSPIASAPG